MACVNRLSRLVPVKRPPEALPACPQSPTPATLRPLHLANDRLAQASCPHLLRGHPAAIRAARHSLTIPRRQHARTSGLDRNLLWNFFVNRDDNLFDGLANFRPTAPHRFSDEFPVSGAPPAIGFVVVGHVAKQQAGFSLMNDQPKIAACAHRPEVRISHLVELVKLHTWIDRIELQVKRRSS